MGKIATQNAQEDSEDSGDDQKRMCHRHSWYTTNRMRGGHAPDVLPGSLLARAEAIAKARAAAQNETVETALGKPSAMPTPAAAGSDGRRLQNAVCARSHRSPSSTYQDPPKTKGDVGGPHAASTGGGVTGDAGKSQTNSAQPRPKKSKPGSRELMETPRTGGVSARLHRSPSYVLRENGTRGGESVTAETSAADATLVVRSSSAVNAAGKEAADRSGATAVSASVRTPTSTEKKGAGTVGTSSSAIGTSSGKQGKLGAEKARSGKNIAAPSQGSTATKPAKKGDTSAHGSDAAVAGRNSAEKAAPAAAEKAFHDVTLRHDDNTIDRDSCLEEDSVACLVTNHIPFSNQPEKKVSLSKGELGRVSTSAVEDDSSVSPIEKPPPSPAELPSGAAAAAAAPGLGYGGRRPSMGPANPRAMYGHTPPPPVGKPKIVRRPSSILAPPPPSLQGKQPGGGGHGDGWGNQAANRGTSGKREGGETSSVTGGTLSARGGQENGGNETGSPGEYDGTSLGLSPRRTQYNFKVEEVQLMKIDETGAGSTGQQQPYSLGETAACNQSQHRKNTGANGSGARASGAGDTAVDSSATSGVTARNGKKGLSLDDLLAQSRNRAAAAKKKKEEEVKKLSSAVKGVDKHSEHGESEDPTGASWEQQLRTMAGVGPGPDVSEINMSSSSCAERPAERGGGGAGKKSNTDKKVRLLSTIPIERRRTHTWVRDEFGA